MPRSKRSNCAVDSGPFVGSRMMSLGPVVREDELGGRTLEREHRARPVGVAAIEAKRRPAARVALRELLAVVVDFDLEQPAVAIVDAAVVVPVVLPACDAQLEREP